VNLTKKCVFAGKVLKNHTDLFAANAAHVWGAGAAVSIISLQNWPQARFVRFQRNPQQEKAKVVRPEQIPVTIFPQKSHPEARQTAGMRYNV